MQNELYIISGLLNKRRWERYGQSINPSDLSSKEAKELFIRLTSLHQNNSDNEDLSRDSFNIVLPEVNEDDIDSILEDFTVRVKLGEISMNCALMGNTSKLLTLEDFLGKIQKHVDSVESTTDTLADRIVTSFEEDDVRYETGISSVDKNLCGGLSPGELFMLASPPHGGKTHWLTSLSTGYLLNGHEVIHFILEDKPNDVFKYYASAIGSKEQVEKLIADKTLTLLDYSGTTCYTSGMDRDLKELDRERTKPLVVIVDYADRMKVHGRQEAHRHTLTTILEDIRRTANKHNAIMLTATQGDADAWTRQVPTMDNLSESKIGKSQTADVIVFWSQTPEEKFRGNGRLVTVKARARRISQPIIRINADWDEFNILEV